MSNLIEAGVAFLWNDIELSSPFSNQHKIRGTLATFLETLVPLRVAVEEGLYYVQQQQTTSLFQQLPQTQTQVVPGNSNWLSIFITYTDTDQRFLPKINEILQTIQFQVPGIGWKFGEIARDTRWKMARQDYLKSADLILLLVTPAFVATDFCYCEQLRWAIIKHEQELSYVIPVLLQACLWDQTPFAGLSSITPCNGKAVDQWRTPNLAYQQIAIEIRNTVVYLKQRQ